jgi:O-succinylbenzoic acid--CoA ligase
MKINGISLELANLDDFEALKKIIEEWNSDSKWMTAHTSGSIGEPKAIELSKASMRDSSLITSRYFNIPSGSSVLLALPLSFIAGKMMVVRSLVNDWNLLITDSTLNPEIPFEQIDFAAFTPLQAENILKSQFEKFNAIGTVILGGGAISTTLLSKLKSCTNRIFATYGMTETITHVAASELKEQSDKLIFEALPGVEFGKDYRGCLKIVAEHLNSEEFVTNDLVTLIDPFHFQFEGRVDNVINSGGLKIFPEKIEAEIEPFLEVPFYITSIDDESLGKKVVLMIEGKLSDLEESIRLIETHFAGRVDRPREIYCRDNFQYTHTGKVLKKFF